MASAMCTAQYNIPCGVNPPHKRSSGSRHVHLLHVTTGGPRTDAGFETGIVAGSSVCADFETGVGADAAIGGKTGPPDAVFCDSHRRGACKLAVQIDKRQRSPQGLS
jgi:hypothetical protein